MKINDKLLDNYLDNGIDYRANTIIKADVGDLQQLASDSYQQGWSDALSERQTTDKSQDQPTKEALNIGVVINWAIDNDHMETDYTKDELIKMYNECH